MASLHQRSFANVGFGLLHGCWNAGQSRRKKRFIENGFVKLDNRQKKKKEAKKQYSESTVLSKITF